MTNAPSLPETIDGSRAACVLSVSGLGSVERRARPNRLARQLNARGRQIAVRSLATNAADGRISVSDPSVTANCPELTKSDDGTSASAWPWGTPPAHAVIWALRRLSCGVIELARSFSVGRSLWRKLIAAAAAGA